MTNLEWVTAAKPCAQDAATIQCEKHNRATKTSQEAGAHKEQARVSTNSVLRIILV